MNRKTLATAAALAFALSGGSVALAQEAVLKAVQEPTQKPAPTQNSTPPPITNQTPVTNSASGAETQPSATPLTKDELKAQRKQQKHEERAAKANANAAKSQAKAKKEQDKSMQESEKAAAPKQ